MNRDIIKMASKGKGKEKVKSPPPPVEVESPTSKEVVPGKLSEKAWYEKAMVLGCIHSTDQYPSSYIPFNHFMPLSYLSS